MHYNYYLGVSAHDVVVEAHDEVGRVVDSPRLQPEQKQSIKKAIDDCFRIADEVLDLFSKFERMREDWPTDYRYDIDREINRFSQDLYYDTAYNRSSIRLYTSRIAAGKGQRELKFYANDLTRELADHKERLCTLAKNMRYSIEDFLLEKEEILRIKTKGLD